MNGNFDDAWAVGGHFGYRNVAFHWDGAAWNYVFTPQGAGGGSSELNGVWALAPDDVWAVGSAGLLLHWDGGSFTPYPSPVTGNYNAVWGSSSNSVWAVTQSGATVRYDGSSWSTVNTGWSMPAGYSITGTGPNDVYIGGASGSLLHWNGASYTAPFGYPTDVRGLWASGPCDVLATGNGIYRWNGTGWSNPYSGVSAFAVSGTSPSNVWTAGGANIGHWNGASWSFQPLPSPAGLLYGISVAQRGLWAVGLKGAIATSTGGPVSVYTRSAIPTNASVTDVYAVSATDAFAAATDGSVLRWNGTNWTATSLGTTQWLGISGTSASDVWVVGLGGAIRHFDGTTWSTKASYTTAQLNRVVAFAPNDAWAVGYGVTLHWTGTVWNSIAHPAGATTNFTDVWGSSAGSVWAVGSGNKLIWNVGAGWGLMTTPVGQAMASVWGSSATNVWFPTRTGTAVKYNGLTFSTLTGWPVGINRLWGTSATDLYAVTSGASGLYHFDGTTWTEEETANSYDLYGVAGAAGKIWAVGGHSAILGH